MFPTYGTHSAGSITRRKLTNQAQTLLEESLRRDPTIVLHQFHLGMAYVQSGDWRRARPLLANALKQPHLSGVEEARRALAMIGE